MSDRINLCPTTGNVCDLVATGGCSGAPRRLCVHLDVAPVDLLDIKPAVHFVGFRDPQQVANAVAVFGQPDMIHYVWDRRAQADVVKGWDTVVFAKYHDGVPSDFSFDDSNQPDDPAAKERGGSSRF